MISRVRLPEPRGIVLDLDGTVLDHRGSVVRALTAWLPLRGAECDDRFVDAWFTIEREHFTAWRNGLIAFDEQRRRRLRDFLPLLNVSIGPDDELDAVFAEYLAHYEAAWTAFDDVEPFLNVTEQHGLPVVVLTNGATSQQRAKVEALGLTGRVEAVVTAEDVGSAKPASVAFAAACDVLGLPPANVVSIGDDYEADILGARQAGLHAVHLDREGIGPSDETYRIASLTAWEALAAG